MRSALLFSLGAFAFHGVNAIRCLSECDYCCPLGDNGEVLTPTTVGTCIDRNANDKVVCKLSSGRCQHTLDASTPDCAAVTEGPQVDTILQQLSPRSLPPGQTEWEELHAWESLPGSKLHNLPVRGRQLRTLFVPKNHLIPAKNHMIFECPIGFRCDLTYYIYECYPCQSKKDGVAARLLMDGFERSRCAPSFSTGTGSGLRHRMTAYTRVLEPDETYITTFAVDLEFFVATLSFGDAIECDTYDNKAACEGIAGLPCVWEGRCKTNTCIQRGPAPSGCPLDQCVYKDLPQP